MKLRKGFRTWFALSLTLSLRYIFIRLEFKYYLQFLIHTIQLVSLSMMSYYSVLVLSHLTWLILLLKGCYSFSKITFQAPQLSLVTLYTPYTPSTPHIHTKHTTYTHTKHNTYTQITCSYMDNFLILLLTFVTSSHWWILKNFSKGGSRFGCGFAPITPTFSKM